MKRDNLTRHFLIAAVLAIALYAGAFYGIEYLRERKGPWHVTFSTDTHGKPSLVVDEPGIGITNVTVTFPNQHLPATNFGHTVVFSRPITNVPFGKVIYLDTTFLPGAIVLDMFGHEVQLLPRVLMINRRELPWVSGAIHSIPPRPDRQVPSR